MLASEDVGTGSGRAVSLGSGYEWELGIATQPRAEDPPAVQAQATNQLAERRAGLLCSRAASGSANGLPRGSDDECASGRRLFYVLALYSATGARKFTATSCCFN